MTNSIKKFTHSNLEAEALFNSIERQFQSEDGLNETFFAEVVVSVLDMDISALQEMINYAESNSEEQVIDFLHAQLEFFLTNKLVKFNDTTLNSTLFLVPIIFTSREPVNYHNLEDSHELKTIIEKVNSMEVFGAFSQVNLAPHLYDPNDLKDINAIEAVRNQLLYDIHPTFLNENDVHHLLKPSFDIKKSTQHVLNGTHYLQLKFMIGVSVEPLIEPKKDLDIMDNWTGIVSEQLIKFFSNEHNPKTTVITTHLPDDFQEAFIDGLETFHEFAFTTQFQLNTTYYQVPIEETYVIVAPFSKNKEHIDSFKIFVIHSEHNSLLFSYERPVLEHEDHNDTVEAINSLLKFCKIDSVQMIDDIVENEKAFLMLLTDDIKDLPEEYVPIKKKPMLH